MKIKYAMKKVLLLCFVTLLFMNCSTDNQEENDNNYILNVGVSFTILNGSDEDLLNKNTNNSLNSNQIRLEHLHTNGEYVNYYYEYLDNKYGWDIITDNSPYVFVYGNRPFKEFIINNKITGVIHWNSTERDTIVTELYRTSNLMIKNKVWVNGELKYDFDNGLVPEIITFKKNHL